MQTYKEVRDFILPYVYLVAEIHKVDIAEKVLESLIDSNWSCYQWEKELGKTVPQTSIMISGVDLTKLELCAVKESIQYKVKYFQGIFLNIEINNFQWESPWFFLSLNIKQNLLSGYASSSGINSREFMRRIKELK